MPDCAKLSKCIFFNDKMKNTPSIAELIKKQFCRGDFQKCARYIVGARLGPDKVPNDMFPINIERAMELIKPKKI
jgi:hypothetical protein